MIRRVKKSEATDGTRAHRIVVWLLIKARKAARLWQEFLRNEVFMKAGWDAVAVESTVYHKAGSLGDDGDACVCVHGHDFMVESMIDVFPEVKAMLEHKADVNVVAIIGPGQGTEAKIVKQSCPGVLLVSRGLRIPNMRVI